MPLAFAPFAFEPALEPGANGLRNICGEIDDVDEVDEVGVEEELEEE